MFISHRSRTGRHTSRTDKKNHATVRLKTVVQLQDGTHQIAHIHVDEYSRYIGHELFSTVRSDAARSKR